MTPQVVWLWIMIGALALDDDPSSMARRQFEEELRTHGEEEVMGKLKDDIIELGSWDAVKERYQDPVEMYKRVHFREKYVLDLLKDIKRTHNLRFTWPDDPPGSRSPTSDFDLTIAVENTASVNHLIDDEAHLSDDVKAARLFFQIIKEVFHASPAKIFDTNIYVRNFSFHPFRRSSSFSRWTQDVAALTKIRRYMGSSEWNSFVDAIASGNRDPHSGRYADFRVNLDEADATHILYRKLLFHKLAEGDTALQQQFQQAKSDDAAFSIIESTIQKTDVDRVLEAEYTLFLDGMGKVREKQIALKRMRLNPPNSDSKSEETRQWWRNKEALDEDIRRTTAEATYFAPEAYSSEGAFFHIVRYEQAGKDASALAHITTFELLCSMNEQAGDFLKDVNFHYKDDPASALVQSSKYLKRFYDAIALLDRKIHLQLGTQDWEGVGNVRDIVSAIEPLVDIRRQIASNIVKNQKALEFVAQDHAFGAVFGRHVYEIVSKVREHLAKMNAEFRFSFPMRPEQDADVQAVGEYSVGGAAPETRKRERGSADLPIEELPGKIPRRDDDDPSGIRPSVVPDDSGIERHIGSPQSVLDPIVDLGNEGSTDAGHDRAISMDSEATTILFVSKEAAVHSLGEEGSTDAGHDQANSNESGLTDISFVSEESPIVGLGEEGNAGGGNDHASSVNSVASIPVADSVGSRSISIDPNEQESSLDGNAIPSNTGDSTQSRGAKDDNYFHYEKLKNAVLSGGRASDFSTAQDFRGFPKRNQLSTDGYTVVTTEGIDGATYKWRITAQIGRGAQGVVYHADAADLLAPSPASSSASSSASTSSFNDGSSVAIKFAFSERGRAAVLNEAHRLNWMKNTRGVPKLMSVARYGENGGILMVSQFFPRGDLRQYLDKKPKMRLSREEMWATAKDAFLTLNAIHRRFNIVHGDISPSNLFLDDNNKIVFGDWGGGFNMLYVSQRRVSDSPTARPATPGDDFIALFLSIFQMDDTISFRTGHVNDIVGRIYRESRFAPRVPRNFLHIMAEWDERLASLMVENSDKRVALWKVLRETRSNVSRSLGIDFIAGSKSICL